jgi:hypothetical protein
MIWPVWKTLGPIMRPLSTRARSTKPSELCKLGLKGGLREIYDRLQLINVLVHRGDPVCKEGFHLPRCGRIFDARPFPMGMRINESRDDVS